MKKIISDTRVPVKIWTNDIEEEAEQQLRKMAQLPFIYKHLAVMPDVHAGRGSTIGTVIATKGAIIPSAVGVDIGCGMSAVKLPVPISNIEYKDLKDIRSEIERLIPVGCNSNDKQTERASKLFKTLGILHYPGNLDRAHSQLGSLGGGNHFIEFCEDTTAGSWIMLHSGSRNIGKKVADYHISKAKDLMVRYFIDIPDPELAYLVHNTQEFKEYINDLLWCQRYARLNRLEMMTRVLEIFIRHYKWNISPKELMKGMIDCHHNYTQMENHYGQNVWVTRKGAVSAREGQWGIIPGSMGAKSFIVSGKGNVQSFCSCSHGAGRRMSRRKARDLYTKEDLAEQTRGVECRKDDGIVDEIPAAYKDIEQVMKNQEDLVNVEYQLKQLICVKG